MTFGLGTDIAGRLVELNLRVCDAPVRKGREGDMGGECSSLFPFCVVTHSQARCI